MPRPLKVFRTAVGFRDAYVAAPSKAAALRAWGTDKDLFARGAAELVSDPQLTAEALSKPGEVVYRTRGGLEEQVAALGPLPQRKSPKRKREESPAPAPAKPKAPKPRPSRAKIEAVEAEIAALEQEQSEAEVAMRARERELAEARKTMEARFAQKLKRLRDKAKNAREDYQAALRSWEP